MSEPTLEQLQYPIGKMVLPEQTTPEQRRDWIRNIAETPAALRAAVAGLTPEQLATPYRPDGWTALQVVHHLADGHMNAYIRFKLALTEDTPTIKPFDEVAWARLDESRTTPAEISVKLFEALHARWVRLLESMSDADFERTFRHPQMGTLTLGRYLAAFAWHGRHHVAQIASLRQRKGWA